MRKTLLTLAVACATTACTVSFRVNEPKTENPQEAAQIAPPQSSPPAPKVNDAKPASEGTATDAAKETTDFDRALASATEKHQQEEREQERQHAVPAAVGTFRSFESYHSQGNECELWNGETLTLTISDSGSATWSAFENADGVCDSGTFVPTHCGERGSGFLEEVDGKTRLVTAERSSYGLGGGTPSMTAIWKCGTVILHTPIDWEPPRSDGCVNMGSEPDAELERDSQVACQVTAQFAFQELRDPGVELTIAPGSLSFVHGAKTIKLKRVHE